MARTITIRILGEQSEQPSADAKSNKEEENNKTWAQVFGLYAMKKSWGVIKSEAEYYAGKYLGATENYKMQTAVKNASTAIDTTVSLGMAAFAGGKMGASFGDGGAVAGSIVGLVLTAVAKTIQALNTYRDSSNAIINNAYGNYFYGERAGFETGGHGTEN